MFQESFKMLNRAKLQHLIDDLHVETDHVRCSAQKSAFECPSSDRYFRAPKNLYGSFKGTGWIVCTVQDVEIEYMAPTWMCQGEIGLWVSFYRPSAPAFSELSCQE